MDVAVERSGRTVIGGCPADDEKGIWSRQLRRRK
jgi:hypothetical protein